MGWYIMIKVIKYKQAAEETAIAVTGGSLLSMGMIIEVAGVLQLFTVIGGFFIMMMTLVLTFRRVLASFKDKDKDEKGS